jgi:hypothetical protein
MNSKPLELDQLLHLPGSAPLTAETVLPLRQHRMLTWAQQGMIVRRASRFSLKCLLVCV